jgi:hypothetical protein
MRMNAGVVHCCKADVHWTDQRLFEMELKKHTTAYDKLLRG